MLRMHTYDFVLYYSYTSHVDSSLKPYIQLLTIATLFSCIQMIL